MAINQRSLLGEQQDIDDSLRPSLPFIWPETRILDGISSYAEIPPWRNVIANAASFFGIIHGMDEAGVELLASVIQESPILRVRLLIALYPACPTRMATLERACRLKDQFGDRAEFKLLLTDRDEERPTNLLCVVQPNDSRPTILIGPSGNFGLNQPTPSQVNLSLHGEGELLEQCRNWFNYVWYNDAVPLRHATSRIPELQPAKGDPHATVLWNDYFQTCQQELDPAEHGEQAVRVTVDPKTGETTLADDTAGQPPLPTEVIGVPRFDEVCRKMTEIVSQGCLATIDRESHIPPFDCPIRPEWFGIDSSRQYGMITQTTGLRISVIDDKDLKKLNAFRNRTRTLLTALSFPWAEGLRWIPNAVKPLFEKEIERVNVEGLKLFGTAIGEEVGTFVDDRRERIAEEAQRIYEQWHPGKSLPQGVVDKIAEESKKRLQAAAGGQVLAKVCYTPMQIGLVTESRWTTPWGQYLDFLAKVVEFPRRCFTNKFALTGVKIEADEVLRVMDVAKDHLVKAHFDDRRVDRIAESELDLLATITSSNADDRRKCSALFLLLEGTKPEEVLRSLDPLCDPDVLRAIEKVLASWLAMEASKHKLARYEEAEANGNVEADDTVIEPVTVSFDAFVEFLVHQPDGDLPVEKIMTVVEQVWESVRSGHPQCQMLPAEDAKDVIDRLRTSHNK